MREIVILSPDNIQEAAIEFIKLIKNRKIFAFYGIMGAGKTTFIKAICKELDVKDLVSSPSFAIVYEYSTFQNRLIYHFDLYRLNDASELFDLGYEEYFYSGNLCFIEWPEKAEHLLPEDCVRVYISVLSDGSRILGIKD